MLHYVRVVGHGSPSCFEVARNVRSFLATSGFRETPRLRARCLKFSRSSSLNTLFAFDPSRWKVEITVDPELRTAQMYVHTDGQVVTPREKHYFDVFFSELVGVMAPETQSCTALQIHESGSLSASAAQAALNENVATILGFMLLLPAAILLLHLAVEVPMFWSILWGFGASISVAYAWLFSIRNRPRLRMSGADALPSPACGWRSAA